VGKPDRIVACMLPAISLPAPYAQNALAPAISRTPSPFTMEHHRPTNNTVKMIAGPN
jgi:hypothetical protein